MPVRHGSRVGSGGCKRSIVSAGDRTKWSCNAVAMHLKTKTEEVPMNRQTSYVALLGSVAVAATIFACSASAQTVDTARIEAGGQNDWLTYHGSYKSYHYSPLAQINASNVSNLGVAWIHIPG